jgi:hypothetical protein
MPVINKKTMKVSTESLKPEPFIVRVGFMDVPVFMDHEANGNEARGMYYPHENKIKLDTTLVPQEQAEVLIHEVLHAIWADRVIGDKATEEKAVVNLAKGIALLVRDNPNFFDTIKAALNGTPLPLTKQT